MRADVRDRTSRPFLDRLVGRLGGSLVRFYRRRCFAEFGRRSVIQWPSLIVGSDNVRVGDDVAIWPGSRIEALVSSVAPVVSIGDGVVIQPRVHIAAAFSVTIGRGVLIASDVYITDHDHEFADPGAPPIQNTMVTGGPTYIGDFAWIGEKVCVLKNVSIGKHSVIGAGSVVTTSIPEYSIAVGNPARVLRRLDPGSGEWNDCR